MLGKAEPLAQPGSGFAFPVQQHPEDPAALVRQHPCHHRIPSAGRGTVPQPTVPLLTIPWPPAAARQHQPGALQHLARMGAPPAWSRGPSGEKTLPGGMSLGSHGQVLSRSSRKLGVTGRWMGMPKRAHDPPAPGAPNPQDHPAHLTPGQGEALPSSPFLADPINLGGKRALTCREPLELLCLPGTLVSAVGSGLQGGGLCRGSGCLLFAHLLHPGARAKGV